MELCPTVHTPGGQGGRRVRSLGLLRDGAASKQVVGLPLDSRALPPSLPIYLPTSLPFSLSPSLSRTDTGLDLTADKCLRPITRVPLRDLA